MSIFLGDFYALRDIIVLTPRGHFWNFVNCSDKLFFRACLIALVTFGLESKSFEQLLVL